MKICIMLRHYEQLEGGVKHYTRSLLPQLFTLGPQHQYTLLYQNPKLVGTYAQFANVEELVVKIPGTVLWDQVAVPWVSRKRHFDIVFNPKFTVPILGRAKKIWVLHGSEWFVIPEHFTWYDRIYVAASVPVYSREADAIVSVAKFVKDDLLKEVSIDPGKVFPIYNGINPRDFYFIDDPQRLQAVRSKYQLPEKFIIWVGQIGTRKNIQRLLQAFKQLSPDFPHDLVIAGEQRKLQGGKEAVSEIEKLGLTDRIRFLGWVNHDELPAIYRLADHFCFPSIYEGFGIPLIEAMACGCPVVSANIGAPPEVCEDAAVLVDPYDVDAIAAGMRRVMSDQALREQLIARGLERAAFVTAEQRAEPDPRRGGVETEVRCVGGGDRRAQLAHRARAIVTCVANPGSPQRGDRRHPRQVLAADLVRVLLGDMQELLALAAIARARGRERRSRV
jgi:glycosyltransferase involved in cell wall biosynthesis